MPIVISAFSSRYLAASPTVAAATGSWSNVSESMNTQSSPSEYRYCMGRLSTVAVSTLTPALNVLSTTLPLSTFFRVVRTNAPPLPGLTCWNSTTVQSWPSRLSTSPFFRSFVEAIAFGFLFRVRWRSGRVSGASLPTDRDLDSTTPADGGMIDAREEVRMTEADDAPAPVVELTRTFKAPPET